MKEMKAIVFKGVKQVEYETVPIPEVLEGWTLVKISHAGICGSDMTIYHGKHPRAKAPLIMGHEFSGYVESEHPEFAKGTLVTCFPYIPCKKCERCLNGQYHVCKNLKLIGIDRDGGMAEYATVPDDMLYRVPENVTPEAAAFIEPIGISVHAARTGGYKPGDSVIVFGAGGIGLSTALTLRNFGAEHVIICEPNPVRSELAKDMGFDVLDARQDVVKQVYERTEGNGVSFVYDCAGAQPVIDVLPDVVKINGRIVIVAGYKEPPRMNFQKGMFREFSIQFVRNCTRDDFLIACGLIKKDRDYTRILNCILPLSECKQGFEGPDGAYKVIFKVE